MAIFYLQYPRLSISVSVSDTIVAEFRKNFAPAILDEAPSSVDLAVHACVEAEGISLMGNGVALGVFESAADAIFFAEEFFENALIQRLDDWVGFHAGAAVLNGSAIVVVGHPDTGKTTSMFQLAELGLALLCEEVAPVDPATKLVQPFPQVLTLARSYAEQFLSFYPVDRGVLSYWGAEMARYAPQRMHHGTTRLGAIVFPAFDPSSEPKIEETHPSAVLVDLLQYCFPPRRTDESLFDDVIRILDGCRLFNVRSRDIPSARRLFGELITILR